MEYDTAFNNNTYSDKFVTQSNWDTMSSEEQNQFLKLVYKIQDNKLKLQYDKLFLLKTNQSKCIVCDGLGKINETNESYNCSFCEGSGYYISSKI
jgi:hypothetical protein